MAKITITRLPNATSILGLTAGASSIFEHESGNNQADGTAITAFL